MINEKKEKRKRKKRMSFAYFSIRMQNLSRLHEKARRFVKNNVRTSLKNEKKEKGNRKQEKGEKRSLSRLLVFV